MPLDHFMADFISKLHTASVQNEHSNEKKEVAATKIVEDGDTTIQKKDEDVIY